MTSEARYEYARDDFNYPRFIQRFLQTTLNKAIKFVEESDLEQPTLKNMRFGIQALAIFAMLMQAYLVTGLLVALWIFLDQLNLHLYVDRNAPASRFRHLTEELPLILGLALHMWLQGHIWTGFAALVGITGLYLLTNLQMKYDLMAIQIPRLYFLRWDRMGIIFLFTLFGAWPGERSYLWVVLLAWFLAALTYYDYIWILIQLAKKKK